MMKAEYFLEEAKEYETEFRAILDKYKIKHQELTVDEIYQRYTEGDRSGKWTILDFYEKDNQYLFSCEDIEFLSGEGRTDLWTMEDGEAVRLKNVSWWAS